MRAPAPPRPVVDPIPSDLASRHAQQPAARPAVERPEAVTARRRWWLPGLAAGATLALLTILAQVSGPWPRPFETGTGTWWALTAAVHLPFAVIGFFLVGGMVERVGYFWRGRAPERPGRLPAELPSVCVQLPMFDEHEVAQRLIEAACAMTWPTDRLTVQVLDDSSDADTRRLVAEVCARVRAERGIDCTLRHRTDRRGYKAGALEEGRRRTDADYLVIFDADFVPTPDFLLRTVPHFYDADGVLDDGLALVQAQWGHLNHDESSLTRAQSLWLDDHHTVQMSWRSARWEFVNFTGTAGVWRARAVEEAGGWRATSLVEDCELSFRHLFAGYRTKFVKDVVVPAELPATFTAYKAQQKRWTQGWVQLQKLHLGTLLLRFPCSPLRRLHLGYHMCIAWQWPAWAIWAMTFPLAISTGLWFGELGATVGALLYLAPTLLWLVFVTVVATIETRHTYDDAGAPGARRRRLARMLPYVVVNTGMLPHQFSAFAEGLFGPLHSEFERTPKAGSVRAGTGPSPEPAPTKVHAVKIHWPYVVTEALYVAYQVVWAVLFAMKGLLLCAIGASFLAACVIYVAYHYGDHAGRVCGIVRLQRSHSRSTTNPWTSPPNHSTTMTVAPTVFSHAPKSARPSASTGPTRASATSTTAPTP